MIKEPNAIDFPLVYILVFLTVFWPCPVNESYVDDTLFFTIYWCVLKKYLSKEFIGVTIMIYFWHHVLCLKMSRALLDWLWIIIFDWQNVNYVDIDIFYENWNVCKLDDQISEAFQKLKSRKWLTERELLNQHFLFPGSNLWLVFRRDFWYRLYGRLLK